MANQKSGGSDRKQSMGQADQQRETMQRADRQQQAQKGKQTDNQKGGQGQGRKDR